MFVTSPAQNKFGSSCVSGTSAADTHDHSNNTNGGGAGGGTGNHASHKVRCPHCDRGFSPSVAPTHISICARVENRPRGAYTKGTHPNATPNGPPQKALDTAAPGVKSVSANRRMQQEKVRTGATIDAVKLECAWVGCGQFDRSYGVSVCHGVFLGRWISRTSR